jgi:hypothetical protein
VAGEATVMTFHVDPFHRSASGDDKVSPAAISVPPGSIVRPNNPANENAGVDTTLHDDPFQWIAIGCKPPPTELAPTAQTFEADTTCTEDKTSRKSEMFGLGIAVQAVPSKCSVSVICAESGPLGYVVPTAHTSVDEAASTPWSSLMPVPGLGEGMMLQLVPSKCSINVCVVFVSVR